MPQLTQLPFVFWSQLFWLAVAFGFTFFVIGRGMLPKIQGTVDLRDKAIADDLRRAQDARSAADQTEAQWRERMDSSRSEAALVAQEAKDLSARETEAKLRAAAEQIQARVDAAHARIGEALNSARGEIESVATEVTREMVQRLTGISVDHEGAVAAVKAELDA